MYGYMDEGESRNGGGRSREFGCLNKREGVEMEGKEMVGDVERRMER